MTEFPGGFPSNSKRVTKDTRPDDSDKKLAKVVEGTVVRRKKPLGRRLREMIVGDNESSVSEYLLMEVVIPATKDLIADVATMGIERKLYGEVRSGGGRRGFRGSGPSPAHVRYDRLSSPPRRDERPQLSRQARASHDFGEIIFPTRPDAVAVLDGLLDFLDRYESVTVSTMLDLAGESSNFTDERYGWTDLRGSQIRRVNGGYLLELPRTEVLER